MRFEFDLSLNAFSLEASGAAAHAIGVCHTLTLAIAVAETEVARAAFPVEQDAGAAHCISVPREGPATLTITL